MSLTDGYRKGWAIRYLREAKAELVAAQKAPYMAASLILEAMRKAQAAIYYSLGDPASLEAVVRQTILQKQSVKDPVLRCLVEIEKAVQEAVQTPDPNKEKVFQQADDLVQIASDIVKLLTDEKAD